MLKQHIQREVILNGVLNVVINGGIAWLLFKQLSEVPMWGEHGFGLDLIVTACILMFLLTLIVFLLHRSKVAKGKISAQAWDTKKPLHRLLQGLPQTPLLIALIFGGLGLFVIAPLTLLALTVLGINTFSPMDFALFKAVWAGVIAALLIGPVILLSVCAERAEN